jgi:hypothetical protein
MSEIIIRNNISNTNFIIEYNLDMKLPKEADDSRKFLEDLINSEYQTKNFKNQKENYNEKDKDKEYDKNNYKNYFDLNLNKSKEDINDVILSNESINEKEKSKYNILFLGFVIVFNYI